MSADLRFTREASMVLVAPCSQRARQWVEDHVHVEPWQWQGAAFAAETRQAVDLVAHATEAGLAVETD